MILYWNWERMPSDGDIMRTKSVTAFAVSSVVKYLHIDIVIPR